MQTGLLLGLALATVGVDFGWRPTPEGEVEYIIQIEPEVLDAVLREGQPIESTIPPELRGVKRFRIQVGTGPLPKEGPPQSVARPSGVVDPSIPAPALPGGAAASRSASTAATARPFDRAPSAELDAEEGPKLTAEDAARLLTAPRGIPRSSPSVAGPQPQPPIPFAPIDGIPPPQPPTASSVAASPGAVSSPSIEPTAAATSTTVAKPDISSAPETLLAAHSPTGSSASPVIEAGPTAPTSLDIAPQTAAFSTRLPNWVSREIAVLALIGSIGFNAFLAWIVYGQRRSFSRLAQQYQINQWASELP